MSLFNASEGGTHSGYFIIIAGRSSAGGCIWLQALVGSIRRRCGRCLVTSRHVILDAPVTSDGSQRSTKPPAMCNLGLPCASCRAQLGVTVPNPPLPPPELLAVGREFVYAHVVDAAARPPDNPAWFAEARLNWAENVLRCRSPDKVALVEASTCLPLFLSRPYTSYADADAHPVQRSRTRATPSPHCVASPTPTYTRSSPTSSRPCLHRV